MEVNFEKVANILQQRVARMAAEYEGHIAVLTAQVQQLNEALAEREAKSEAKPEKPTK